MVLNLVPIIPVLTAGVTSCFIDLYMRATQSDPLNRQPPPPGGPTSPKPPLRRPSGCNWDFYRPPTEPRASAPSEPSAKPLNAKQMSERQRQEQVTESSSSVEKTSEKKYEAAELTTEETLREAQFIVEPSNSESEQERTEQAAESSSSSGGTADENHEAPETTSEGSVGDKILNVVCSKPFIIGTGVVVGAAGAVVLAPVAVGALGFSATGIQAGSAAASMMSTLGGGATASGSVVAVMQSVGATGTVLGSAAATGTAGAAGAACGAAATGIGTVIADRLGSNSKNQEPKPEQGRPGNERNGGADDSHASASTSGTTSGTVLINTTCRICGKVFSRAVAASTENRSSDNDGDHDAGAAVTPPPTCDACAPFFNHIVGIFLPDDDVNAEDTGTFSQHYTEKIASRYDCGICESKIRENTSCILCVDCNKWVHAKCTGLNKVSFNRIAQDVKNKKRTWSCHKCQMEVGVVLDEDDTDEPGENYMMEMMEKMLEKHFRKFKEDIGKGLDSIRADLDNISMKVDERYTMLNDRISTVESKMGKIQQQL